MPNENNWDCNCKAISIIRVDNIKFDLLGVHNKYADYIIVECTSCHEQYVHDEEHSVLYYDSKDHSKKFLTYFSVNEDPKHYPICCKGCGKVDWDFSDVNETEKAESGPWRIYI
jgi:endogenous inhibitor of DNA gyrase (YacG/DUF329 family)